MPDPLTLSVMSQIVRKAGGKELQQESVPAAPCGEQVHVTDRQAVLLTELIHKSKPSAGPSRSSQTGRTGQSQDGAVTLDALVKRAKTR